MICVLREAVRYQTEGMTQDQDSIYPPSLIPLLAAFEVSTLPHFLTNRIMNPLGVELCPA